MIVDYASLKASVIDWTARDDLDDKVDGFIGSCVADVAERLSLYMAECFLTSTAFEGQSTLVLPDGYNAALGFYVNGVIYQRGQMRDVENPSHGHWYTIRGEEVVFFPTAAEGQTIRLEFRGVQKGGAAGTGVSTDDLGQLFFRQKFSDGITEESPDGRKRYPILLDNLTQPSRGIASTEALNVDGVDRDYNSVEAMIRRFPNVFLKGALFYAYDYIQDSARKAEFYADYIRLLDDAENKLTRAKYGGDSLRIRPVGRKLLRKVQH